VIIATRAAPELAATAIPTAPEPVPLAGLIVTQLTPLAVVQPQLDRLALTVTAPAPPLAETVSAFAERAREHGAALWVTVKL
jgi:hypothetical protein